MIKKSIQILIAIVAIELISTSVARAAEYTPPQEAPPSGHTRGTGSRSNSCLRGERANIPLTILAPITHVGQTAQEHPTLFWFVPGDRSLPIEVSIYEENRTRERPALILQQQISLKSQPGIMKISLPSNRSGLEVGKRYLWEVSLICDTENRAKDRIARAYISRIAKSKDGDNKQLWYDLLAASEENSSKLIPSNKFITLIEQLAAIENNSSERNINFSRYLQKIASLYQNERFSKN